MSTEFTSIPLSWWINKWRNNDKFQYFSQNSRNIYIRYVIAKTNYRNCRLLGSPINNSGFWDRMYSTWKIYCWQYWCMIVSKVFAVWITNIVCRNIFQIRFKYWSLSLNLVPHVKDRDVTWWSNQVETFSVLLVLCVGNSPVTGEFHAQRPVTRSFNVFFDLCLNKRLSKQSWGWWFETLSHPLWRHSNESWVPAVLEVCGVNLYRICFLSKKTT